MDTTRDRPADEIEITEEMYDAGLEALQAGYCGDGRYALTEDVVAAAYRAMVRASPASSRQPTDFWER